MKHNFVKVASAIPNLQVANCAFNVSKIEELIFDAHSKGAKIVCFPELCVTGATCGDIFFQEQLQENALAGLHSLIENTSRSDITAVVGMPLMVENKLLNVAVVFSQGKIDGIVPKIHLSYKEKRWFTEWDVNLEKKIEINGQSILVSCKHLFSINGVQFGINIGENSEICFFHKTAEIICHLSAEEELVGKNQQRIVFLEQQSEKNLCGIVYSTAGFGESTTDSVYAGNALIVELGSVLTKGVRFSFEKQLIVSEVDVEIIRTKRLENTNFHKKTENPDENNLNNPINSFPFLSKKEKNDEYCDEILSIQISGLAKRWLHTRAERLILGVSGGLDSTLALLVCAKTADKLGVDRKKILGVTMPGLGTTNRTFSNSIKLMNLLGIDSKTISIEKATLQHFEDIEHDPNEHNVTFENAQARERTQILMDLSNKLNGIVIGTGNMSESTLGWSTYNGDHISMYAVNSGVPKTVVRSMVEWFGRTMNTEFGEILQDVLSTPVSPELLPLGKENSIAQKTEDIVGPYELHDFFLYYFVRYGFTPKKISSLAQNAFAEKYDKETIHKWLKIFIKRFFQQQFKRSCSPDGIKIFPVNLSPRGEWIMPSDAIAFELDLD